MINLYLLGITGIILAIMGIMDLKYKQILSIIPTIAIFLVLVVNYQFGENTFYFGVICGLFGLLMWELNLFSGLADIKASILIGLTLVSIKQFVGFMVLFGILGIIYQLFYIKILKKKQGDEIPYLPLFFFVYILLHVLIISI